MNSLTTADKAPLSGNRVVPHNWRGKPFSSITEEDLLSIREYIVEEASVLGLNHGRRKCADAQATNPFSPEFFMGYPSKFWHEVYSQSAREGEAQTLKQGFYEASFQRPRDVLDSSEVAVALSVISAMRDLNNMYCQTVEDLKLPVSAQSLPEWRALLLWFDFKEEDLAIAPPAVESSVENQVDRAQNLVKTPTPQEFGFN